MNSITIIPIVYKQSSCGALYLQLNRNGSSLRLACSNKYLNYPKPLAEVAKLLHTATIRCQPWKEILFQCLSLQLWRPWWAWGVWIPYKAWIALNHGAVEGHGYLRQGMQGQFYADVWKVCCLPTWMNCSASNYQTSTTRNNQVEIVNKLL